MDLTITGAEGCLKWAYHTAATLRDWTVSRGEAGLTLTAQIADVDTFKASQRPLVFLVQRPGYTWRWPITELQIAGGTLTACLGPREP